MTTVLACQGPCTSGRSLEEGRVNLFLSRTLERGNFIPAETVRDDFMKDVTLDLNRPPESVVGF